VYEGRIGFRPVASLPARPAPTNNEAERTERQAVLLRKTSGGTDSAAGSRFVERMLTVVATCKRQGKDVRGYLQEGIESWRHHLTPPSGMPNSS
jgi:transposase